MKKMLACLFVMFVLSGFDGIGSADEGGSGCNYRRYGLDAEKFFLYLTRDTPYTMWRLLPGTGKVRPGRAPHGAFLTTYVNQAAYGSIAGGKGMAYGSLIVAEDYGPDRRLAGLSVMLKVKGYNPEAGDWHWFSYTPEGRATASGRVEACLGCHGTMKENDFLMTEAAR